LKLLLEAGFTPVEAIKIATLNGARFVIVKGDPAENIKEIENVEFVFEDDMGYDSEKLIEPVKGQVGIR
jgi:imidazolonepropionase-like amidohydrolase